MSVRVVARIRPLLDKEFDKDVIVRVDSVEEGQHPTIVKIPSPKNPAEEFSFTFNSVYDQPTTQEMLYTAEVSPHIKSLFNGLDVTIFAYGVTGTGKTHTMRGGLKLADRGVIPRLLSGVFRRGKKITKDSAGETTVDVALSYYEIYNDKVFDLLEPPEKRPPAGLPLREKENRTHVVGLTERTCQDLKDFERLYIEANHNRITAATKLNAHSSRSHAILRVKITQTTGDMVRESTASAIDLAGSEDNRRTDNGKERLVESAAINKSLFVLSQCIDAISRGDKRIPYRESKMTRILSLGQNNGITVMILNLAPMKSYHLDTLSSLNVSSRAKRIEVREIENEVVFKQMPRTTTGLSGPGAIQRQPLRPLANVHNVASGAAAAAAAAKAVDATKPVKAFSVYADRLKQPLSTRPITSAPQVRRSNSTQKRPSESDLSSRPSKVARPSHTVRTAAPVTENVPPISAADIEAMVEKKVSEILASRSTQNPPQVVVEQPDINETVKRRLEALERRIEDEDRREDGRSDGLRYLLAARQHKERGEDAAALRMYELAQPFFPGQAKLLGKIERLRAKLGDSSATVSETTLVAARPESKSRGHDYRSDEEYHADDADDDESFLYRPTKPRARRARKVTVAEDEDGPVTPRAQRLLDIVNSRDLARIKSLHGLGSKKAQDLVDYLGLLGPEGDNGRIATLGQLKSVPGMGGKTVERAYESVAVVI